MSQLFHGFCILSQGNYLSVGFYTNTSQCDIILIGFLAEWLILYCIRYRSVLINGESKAGTSIIGWHQTFNISIGNKICRFIHFNRSPSQRQDEFQMFKLNLYLILKALLIDNAHLRQSRLTILMPNLKDWCPNDRTSLV